MGRLVRCGWLLDYFPRDLPPSHLAVASFKNFMTGHCIPKIDFSS
jgi:hypothetical protein